MSDRRRQFVVAALVAVVASLVSRCAYAKYRQDEFLHSIRCLVGFSTSMIGSPKPENELAAHQRAEELGINLYAAYEDNLETGARFDRAWMLITNESHEYLQFVEQNIDSVPWPEVRIWGVRRKQESLSPECRQKLLALILASPTSEARLAAARWYRNQGKTSESEDAYYAAMTNGLFWDALDAADELLESERYRDDAVQHLLSVVRDSDCPERATYALLNLYDVREQFESLAESCRNEPKDGRNRVTLIDELTRLVERDIDDFEAVNELP